MHSNLVRDQSRIFICALTSGQHFACFRLHCRAGRCCIVPSGGHWVLWVFIACRDRVHGQAQLSSGRLSRTGAVFILCPTALTRSVGWEAWHGWSFFSYPFGQDVRGFLGLIVESFTSDGIILGQRFERSTYMGWVFLLCLLGCLFLHGMVLIILITSWLVFYRGNWNGFISLTNRPSNTVTPTDECRRDLKAPTCPWKPLCMNQPDPSTIQQFLILLCA